MKNRFLSVPACCLLWGLALPQLSSAALEGSPARCCISETPAFRQSNPEVLRKRFELYQELGVNMIRTPVGWRNMERKDGKWSAPDSLATIRLAQASGIKLKMNIGTISEVPRWFLYAHPDALIINENGEYSTNTISLWYPGLHALLEEKLDRVFRYMDEHGLFKNVEFIDPDFGPASEPLYPAMWTMGKPSSTPATFWFYDANAQADFRSKMRAKYGAITSANLRWGSDFKNWEEVTIPLPRVRPGAFWEDVLVWYRDTKRDFVRWQIGNFKKYMAKYKVGGISLLLYVPGVDYTDATWSEAVKSGAGNTSIRIMCDSKFLLDLAGKEHCWLQYTSSGNGKEVEHLRQYMKERGLGDIPMWGENAGDAVNAGNPGHLAQVIVENGLYGLDYTHSYFVFEKDGITPNALFPQLKAAYSRIQPVP